MKLAFVEDNEDTRKVLSHLFEKRGFVVSQFSDGEIASVEIPNICPDVAVIDIGLPGKNGFELAQELRKHVNCQDLLIIALSGYSEDADPSKVGDLGIDELLVKPIHIDQLCDVIATKLAGP